MTTITHESTDVVLQRVSLLSLLYYPEVHVIEDDYSLTDDVAFCLEPLIGLDTEQRDELRRLIGQTIIDPSAYREALFAVVTDLAISEPAEK